jgi:hypothetical protein
LVFRDPYRFRIGRVGPKIAILARRTSWLSAPAMTIGFGVSEKPEKMVLGNRHPVEPELVGATERSKVVCIDRTAASQE